MQETGKKEHPIFAKVFVGAKHYGSKSPLITNKLSAVMLRPSNIGMLSGKMPVPQNLETGKMPVPQNLETGKMTVP